MVELYWERECVCERERETGRYNGDIDKKMGEKVGGISLRNKLWMWVCVCEWVCLCGCGCERERQGRMWDSVWCVFLDWPGFESHFSVDAAFANPQWMKKEKEVTLTDK